MSTERPDAQDLQFEQRLLHSAEADNPTHETRAAWERFTAVTAYVASRVDTVSAVHRVDRSASSEPIPVAPSSVLPKAGAGITLSGVGLGMLAGGLLSAGVWFMLRSEPGSAALDQLNTLPADSSAAAADPGRNATSTQWRELAYVAKGSRAQLAEPSASDTSSGRALPQGAVVPGGGRAYGLKDGAKSAHSGAERTSVADSLSAQVRLLDHAREALRSGRPGYALGWVQRARAEFPRSVLTPDWDFVEIEALRQQGAALAVERAQTFLQRYPADPHAHEVRRGLELDGAPRSSSQRR